MLSLNQCCQKTCAFQTMTFSLLFPKGGRDALLSGEVAGLAWPSYDIHFHRKTATNVAFNWGERDPLLFVMRFTGQAESSCTICGSGDHTTYRCSLSALSPHPPSQGVCYTFNRGIQCSKDPCPFIHCCKT